MPAGAHGEAEVGEEDVGPLQKHVLGLEVAVQHAHEVHGPEGREEGANDVLDDGALITTDVGQAAVEIRVLGEAAGEERKGCKDDASGSSKLHALIAFVGRHVARRDVPEDDADEVRVLESGVETEDVGVHEATVDRDLHADRLEQGGRQLRLTVDLRERARSGDVVEGCPKWRL